MIRLLSEEASVHIEAATKEAVDRVQSEHRFRLAKQNAIDGKQIITDIMSQLVEMHDIATRQAM